MMGALDLFVPPLDNGGDFGYAYCTVEMQCALGGGRESSETHPPV